jgi:RimJ/RimL family protein N-acetyltransferase
MLPSVIDCSAFRLRPWRADDRASLLRHADNRAVARTLRDRFPHPYTGADADAWLAYAAAEPAPEGIYAIEVDGEGVGCVALERGNDIARLTAEIGYWLGEAYWGRGIVSEAVARVTELALEEPGLVRIFAPVFAGNVRSMRVLERNGYVREAILRRSGFKDGAVFDRVIYARTRESSHPYIEAS